MTKSLQTSRPTITKCHRNFNNLPAGSAFWVAINTRKAKYLCEKALFPLFWKTIILAFVMDILRPTAQT
jgi:hypothetical protein